MTVRVSERGLAMPGSPIRELAPLARDAVCRRGLRIHHLNIGQPDLATPPELRNRVRGLSDTCLAYTPAEGTPEFRRIMAEYYRSVGLEVTPEEITATAGASEAIVFAMMACLSVGDEAIVVEPFYTNYRTFAAMAGIRLIPVTARGRDGFHLPPRHVWEEQITPKCRMVILCNPGNPTGTVYDREELELVAGLCREHDLFLLSDEVYREFVYDGRRAISALELPGIEQQVVVVDSLSKRYSACGIRLGCLVTRNPELRQAVLRMAQGRLSAPGLAQIAALGIADLPPHYTEEIRREYERRRDLLYEGLSMMPGVFLRKPEGAFYLMVRLPVEDAADFARWLLTDFEHQGETVMISPGRGFYASEGLGRNEARLAYVIEPSDLQSAVIILREGIFAYRASRGLDPIPPPMEESEELRAR